MHQKPDTQEQDPAGGTHEEPGYILVVDDDLEVRHTITGILKHFGFLTRVACDGRDALVRIREQVPNLLISDVMMPNMNGFQLLMEVHNHWPSLPVILISGHGPEATGRMPRLNRNVDFLQKPFDLSRVVTLVQGKLAAQVRAGKGGSP